MKTRDRKLIVCSCLFINDWYSTATGDAKCDGISGQSKKFKLIISSTNVGAQKYKRTCIAVLKVLSHNGIKIFVS